MSGLSRDVAGDHVHRPHARAVSRLRRCAGVKIEDTGADPYDFDAGDECPVCGDRELVAPLGEPLEPTKPYCPDPYCGWIVGQTPFRVVDEDG